MKSLKFAGIEKQAKCLNTHFSIVGNLIEAVRNSLGIHSVCTHIEDRIPVIRE